MSTITARRYERWDQLCYRAYGAVSESMVIQLRENNRNITDAETDFRFNGGEKIELVDELATQAIDDTETIEEPPWV